MMRSKLLPLEAECRAMTVLLWEVSPPPFIYFKLPRLVPFMQLQMRFHKIYIASLKWNNSPCLQWPWPRRGSSGSVPQASAAGCREGRDLRLWSCWTPGALRQAVKFHHYPFFAVLAFYRRFTACVDGSSPIVAVWPKNRWRRRQRCRNSKGERKREGIRKQETGTSLVKLTARWYKNSGEGGG